LAGSTLKVKIMKSFILVFVHFVSLLAVGQTTEHDEVKFLLEYKLVYSDESKNLNSPKNETFILKRGSFSSTFESLNQSKKDSIKRNFKGHDRNALFREVQSVPRSHFKYRILKDSKQNKVKTIDNLYFSRENFLYEEVMPLMKWEIKNEKKTLLGLPCQLATTSFSGRNYNAWFTTEIPISDGPYKFHGLPGMILEISDTDKHYVFSCISIKKAKPGETIRFDESNTYKTTKKQYFKIFNDFVKNPNPENTGVASLFNNNTEMVVEFKKMIQEKDNPIELVVK
jgi:GLPGLI family protein